MKILSHKLALLFSLSTAVVISLALVSSYLYYQNRTVKMQNTHLILQMDSIMSVNIKLQTSLERKDARQGLGTSFTSGKNN